MAVMRVEKNGNYTVMANYRDEFPRTFVGAFDMLMKKNSQTRESVAPLLHTTERSLHDWLYNPDRKIMLPAR